MSKKRNTQIPEEAIEGAAKYGDEFSITAVDISTYFKAFSKTGSCVTFLTLSNKAKSSILSNHNGILNISCG